MNLINTFTMKEKYISILVVMGIIILGSIPILTYAQNEIEVSTSPLILGQTLSFNSDILNETREINVYLPPSYDMDTLKSYPVIYLLDGSTDEDFIHIAGLVQFATFPWIEMMPESIVVGISNVDRRRDFSYPTTIEDDKKNFPTSGQSGPFISFIEKELKKVVFSNFRCKKESTIIGQSFGGLLATEILSSRPELFDNFIIVSPSLWWDNESLLTKITGDFGQNKSIFVAVGKEGDIMERDAMDLYVRLLANKSESTKVYFKYFEEQDHGDVLHLAVYEAFEKVFSKNEP